MKNEMNENTTAENRNNMHHRGAKMAGMSEKTWISDTSDRAHSA